MTRRSLFFALLALGNSRLAFSQWARLEEHASILGQSNLYLRAITIYIDTTYQRYSYIDNTRNWFNRFFEAGGGIQDIIPEHIAKSRIRWLVNDTSQLADSATRKRRIPLTRIWPITNSCDTLVVDLNDCWFSINGQESLYALRGGCSISFVYDCTKKEFVMIDV